MLRMRNDVSLATCLDSREDAIRLKSARHGLSRGAHPQIEPVAALMDQVPEAQTVQFGQTSITLHRLDTLFPASSGNKAYKLFGHYLAAGRADKQHFVSFGGAWSNHLHALSLFSNQMDMRVTGIVRGLYVDTQNPMLADARRWGMELQLVSKDEYAQRRSPAYIRSLAERFPNAWIIPEGGDDRLGRWGVAALAKVLSKHIPADDTLVVPSGTGACVRALALHSKQTWKLVAALSIQDKSLALKLQQECSCSNPHFRLFDCSGRGYGRIDADFCQLLEQFLSQTGVLLDPLYNGKALRCALQLASRGERVHLLHTGGLQGWRGFLGSKFLKPFPLLTSEIERLKYT